MEKLNELRELDENKHEDIMNIVNILLPDWMEHSAKEYAKEYNELSKTWEELCKKIKTTKKYILIVKYLPLEDKTDNDKWINIIANQLVEKGYLLRRSSELTVCQKSGQAIVTEKMFSYFKKYNAFFPEKWSPCAQSTEVDEVGESGEIGESTKSLTTELESKPVVSSEESDEEVD